MLLPRVLTSCLLVPLIVAVTWYGGLPFFIFVLGLVVFGIWFLVIQGPAPSMSG